ALLALERQSMRTLKLVHVDRNELASAVEQASTASTWNETTSNWLYNRLIAPIELQLQDGELLILRVPSLLMAVPFGALRADTAASFLVERVVIQYDPGFVAPRAGQVARRSTRQRSALFVLADSGIGSPHAPWPFLKSAGEEVRAAVTSLTRTGEWETTELQRHAATPEAVLSHLDHATVLHFSGHAVGDAQWPDRSALLTGIGTNAPHLTLQQIRQQPLSHLRLVV